MSELQTTSAPGVSAAAARRLVDLGACIEHLEATGNLLRVKTEVDPVHELAGIAKRF
ncbi:MAG: UbiD family decarboxylase [Proteobacteria bacterium]|nr:UbiD family decarboxylase [Pseudomonadota bacterium]